MRKLKNEELNRISKEEFKARKKIPVILVLDNVRSMNNVGSIFRTADAFLLEGIYLCGITSQPPHREIEKTALGATSTVAWKYFKNGAGMKAYLIVLDSNQNVMIGRGGACAGLQRQGWHLPGGQST